MIGSMFINYNCYFAEHRIQIADEDNFVESSPLSFFRKEIPYGSIIKLSINQQDNHTYRILETVSDGSGVIVSKTDDGGWHFSSDDSAYPCAIKANADYSELCGYIPSGCEERTKKEKFIQLLRVATECHLSRGDGVSLHASCVCYNDKAVLFTAPSGTGKSTQADLWKEHLGARIINGDRPFIRVSPEGIRAYGVPWDGKEQLFLQENYPVRTIIEVRQAKKNYLRKMSADQAFRLLMKQCFIPMWDDEAKFTAVQTIRRIANTVPFYRLFCLPNADAARLTEDILFQNENNLAKEERTDMKIAEGFVLRNILDEWIVMPTGTNIKKFEGAVVLNEVSAFIWKKLENPTSRDDLLNAVLEEFDIGEEDAARDLDEFLVQLEAQSFLIKN